MFSCFKEDNDPRLVSRRWPAGLVAGILLLWLGLMPVYGQTVTATVGVGSGPRAIAVNPLTNRTYVANNVSNNVSVIVGVSVVLATVPVGNAPSAVALNPV